MQGIEIGRVEALFRYPVKSMRGERLESADLGWHGIEGDRRLALRRLSDHSGFPWLTATSLSDLIRFAPVAHSGSGELPTHVRTPEGEDLPVFGAELAEEIGRRWGAPLEMMQMRHGVFDDACVSVIASSTVEEIGRISGVRVDVRRFRPNVLIRLAKEIAFAEDAWVGGVLRFGEGQDGAAVSVTMRDLRCAMVNLDPESAAPAPAVMKAIFGRNENYAGVYGTVTKVGRVVLGERIYFEGSVRQAI